MKSTAFLNICRHLDLDYIYLECVDQDKTNTPQQYETALNKDRYGRNIWIHMATTKETVSVAIILDRKARFQIINYNFNL